MILDELKLQIEEFEKVSQRIALEITKKAIFERLSPSEIWSRTEGSFNELKKASLNLKELMLTLKPERHVSISRLYDNIAKPLESFKSTLLKETKDAALSSQMALEHLRKAITHGTDLIVQAKDILSNPSKGITEIAKLREISEAKDYISKISAPKTLIARLRSLLDRVEILETSIDDLEAELNNVRSQVKKIKDELQRFREPPQEGNLSEM